MLKTPSQTYYDAFYTEGGWKYGFVREWLWHRRHLVKRFNLPRGDRMLEIACGTGFHTNLFCRMGFDCVGVDSCETAVVIARETFPHREFHLFDAKSDLPFPESSFDVIVTRGCSLYHYDLQSPDAIHATTNAMRYLRTGGRFVLIIASDLSGRRDEGKIWQNRIDDYRRHFERFDPACTVDWHKNMVIASACRHE
jgi:SAM-dependent methyltransferase